MSRNDSTAFFTFLVGIGVGAAAVILQKLQEAIDIGADAYNEAQKS
jgi:hypothetical protein